ncbi:hypothetical protein BASA84_000124 [Batrachochytrium salamandrivorans]|nr:hypothetical protein BASA84_000124 [Batrachochytrium salamandrivorans]
MVALVQTLIAVMLIPVAFAAPASSIRDSTPTSKAPAAAATTGLAVNLTVSTDSKCGKKAGSKCGEGNCCSQYDFCGTTCRSIASVAEGLISNVDQKPVARNMASVELRKRTVALTVSRHLVCVIPPRLLYSRLCRTR